jgi:hypothetical protein
LLVIEHEEQVFRIAALYCLDRRRIDELLKIWLAKNREVLPIDEILDR